MRDDARGRGPGHAERSPSMVKQLPHHWGEIRRDWRVLTIHQRLETSAAYVLTFVIDVVILVALYRLIVSVVGTLILQTLNPLEHAVFQRVFGEIMTLLIALEFNHTLQYVITRDRGIVQGKVIVLIAQLALARKVIVTDPYEVAPASVAALAGLALALGVTYWLMRGRDGDLEAAGSFNSVGKLPSEQPRGSSAEISDLPCCRAPNYPSSVPTSDTNLIAGNMMRSTKYRDRDRRGRQQVTGGRVQAQHPVLIEQAHRDIPCGALLRPTTHCRQGLKLFSRVRCASRPASAHARCTHSPAPAEIGRASCRKECRSRWSPDH